MYKTHNILIFGGTTEGRLLCEFLKSYNIPFTLSVATDYGEELTKKDFNMKDFCLIKGKLDEDEIVEVLIAGKFSLVIDATHPYANVVTKNIKKASGVVNVQYLRVIRQQSSSKNTRVFKTIGDAVVFLNTLKGNILLTTGSKDLEAFTKVEGFNERLFVRILPMVEGLSKCIQLGFRNSNILCMQGSFSKEMNIEMIKMIDAKAIVTKDSGDAGGFENKISAANEMCIETIVIARHCEDEGLTLEAAIEQLKELLCVNTQIIEQTKSKRFPLFVDLHNKKVVVVGGGAIATRRVETLLKFTENITVVSPKITERLQDLAGQQRINWINKSYEKNDIAESFIVIAATDIRQINKAVGIDAKQSNQWVSVCDKKEECSFWFPGIVNENSLVAGIVSETGDHKKLKRNIYKVQEVLQNGN